MKKAKLGRIIRLRNIIQNYLVFVLLFSISYSVPGSDRNRPAYSFGMRKNTFFKVEYCQILWNSVKEWAFWDTFVHFWAILTLILHHSTWTNKKLKIYLFWIDFSDLNQIIYFIWLFKANHVKLFVLIPFVSIQFDLFYNSNHLFFLFWFVFRYRL